MDIEKIFEIAQKSPIPLGVAMQPGTAPQFGGKRFKQPAPRENGAAPPLITVVTAVFNGARSLEPTIQSVLCQTFRNFEYIVIDGGSTDGTLDILRRYDDALECWQSEPDHGIYDAFNKSCQLVHGEWILFLGAGDLLDAPDVLAKAAHAALQAGDIAEIVYGRVCLTDDANSAVKVINWPWTQMRGQWRGGRPMLPHHQGIFHRKTLLLPPRPFDTRFKIAADSKLVYRSIQRTVPVYFDTVVTRAPIGGVSTNPRHFLSTAHEILRINFEFGHKNYAHQLWFYIKAMTKSLAYKITGDSQTKTLIDEYRVITGRNPRRRIGDGSHL